MIRSTIVVIAFGITALLSPVVLAAPSAATSEPAATQPAATQPITAGRDTPAGAMNVFEHAVEIGDIATVADSINGVSDSHRQSVARESILEARLDKAVESRFGHAALLSLCEDCRMNANPTDVKYTNDMWTISPQHPDGAMWNPASGTTTHPMFVFMQRGPDGIWRLGRYVSPEVRQRAATRAAAFRVQRGLTTQPVNPRTAQTEQMNTRLQHTLDALAADTLKTVQDVEASLYPEGAPMVKARKSEQQRKDFEQQQIKQQQAAILATQFDTSTLQGTIGAFTQAVIRRDPDGMAKLMFVPDATDSSYPLARAKRLLAVGDFDQAVMDHIYSKEIGAAGTVSANTFGLRNDAAFAPSLAWDQPREHGDVGMISRGGNGEVAAWYRKVGGIWKQEIRLQVRPPPTLAEFTKDVEDDTAALQGITADINAGKLTTNDQVRDALGNAGLNCFGDPTMTMDFEHGYAQQLPPHERPKNFAAPTDPKTPAGAMNRFIRAVQSADDKTVRDCLWLPNDHNGAAAAAMAHDFVIGAQFARALQKDSPGWDTNSFCYNCDVIPPESLRDYGSDEWVVEPSRPDIAVSNEAIIGRPDATSAQTRPSVTMVHEWTPIMHRGSNGIWRLGSWYPASAHQLQAQTAMLAKKDAILAQATADLNTDKVRTIDDFSDAIFPKLKEIGAQPETTYQQ